VSLARADVQQRGTRGPKCLEGARRGIANLILRGPNQGDLGRELGGENLLDHRVLGRIANDCKSRHGAERGREAAVGVERFALLDLLVEALEASLERGAIVVEGSREIGRGRCLDLVEFAQTWNLES